MSRLSAILGTLKDLSRRATPRRFVAVDFDSSHLYLVQAEQAGGHNRILRMVAQPVPSELDMSDARAAGEFLRRTLDQMYLSSSSLLMSVPRGQAILKPLILPANTPVGEMAGMVQFQVEKELTLRPEEAVIDFTVETHYDAASGAATGGTNVLVAAVKLQVLEYYRQVAQAAGCKLYRLGLRPYANIRCYAACSGAAPDQSVALINVAADETEIDVLVGTSLAFSRSAVLKIPQAGAAPAAVDAAASQLTADIVRSLQSFQALQREDSYRRVVVAGGTGVETALCEKLSRKLSVPCEVFDATAALGLLQGSGSSAFMTALGLAIDNQPERGLPLDFVNPKRPVIPRDMRKVRMLAAVASSVALLLVIIVSGWYWLHTKQEAVDRLVAQSNRLASENRMVVDLARRVKAINRWSNSGREWLDHWAYISCLFPSAGEIYISNLDTNPDGSLSFGVQARTSEVIRELGDILSKAGYEYKPGQNATGANPFGYPYNTAVRLLIKTEMDVNLAKAPAPASRPADDGSADPPHPPAHAARTVAAAETPPAAGTGAEPPKPGTPAALKFKKIKQPPPPRQKP